MLNMVLATLALFSLGIVLWQFVVAMRFPLHQRVADRRHAPPITLLKPLKGVDAETECQSLNADSAVPRGFPATHLWPLPGGEPARGAR